MAVEKIELSREQFLEEIKNNKEEFKKNHTGEAIGQFMIDNAMTKKALGTLTNLGKDKLIKLALEGDKETSSPKQPSNGSEDLAAQIVNSIDEAKKEFHGKGLNKLIKTWSINSAQGLLQKVQPENMQKVGIIGHTLVIGALLLDVLFKDIKEAPKKVISFIKPKPKQQPQEEKAQ